MENIYSYTKKALVILFLPMLFAVFFFLGQTPNGYLMLKYQSKYKQGQFIIENIEGDATGGTASEGGSASFTLYDGKVNGQTATVWRGDVRSFTRVWNHKIGDTIYVWYRDDLKFTKPRNKEETTFRPLKYMYEGFRPLMFITIPVYIFIFVLYKKLKKKLLQNEKK